MKSFITLLTVLFGVCTYAQDQLRPLDKDLSDVAYPYPVAFYEFESQAQQLRMAYIDVVPAKPNGAAVLLLHGKNFNAAYWGQLIGELSGRGYRVIAPDQVGFGKSAKPEGYQYSFSQLAANTKQLLDSLGVGRVVVLGHSMGGMLAARFALQYPGVVDRLVLENPIGLEDYRRFVPYKTVDENYAAELKNTPESYRAYQLKNYYDGRWKPEYDRWLSLLAGWTLHSDYPVIARNAARTTEMVITQPVVHEFKYISCPTLLIIGTRDRTAIGRDSAPKELQSQMGRYDLLGKATKKAIPGSTLIELNNVGHLPHIEAFSRFLPPLLSFLEK